MSRDAAESGSEPLAPVRGNVLQPANPAERTAPVPVRALTRLPLWWSEGPTWWSR